MIEAELLAVIADRSKTQAHAAHAYSQLIGQPVDWKAVNRAIIDRWSVSGLNRVKERAWKLRTAAQAGPFTVKFIDGSPVPPAYLTAVSTMIDDAVQAEDVFGLDVLEQFAAERSAENGSPE